MDTQPKTKPPHAFIRKKLSGPPVVTVALYCA